MFGLQDAAPKRLSLKQDYSEYAVPKTNVTHLWELSSPESLWRRANAPNVSFFTLYGSQFTFSTQLLVLNYLLK